MLTCLSLQIFIFTSFISAQSISTKNALDAYCDRQFLGLENEGITAITADWSDPNTIYAGRGSRFSSGTVGSKKYIKNKIGV